MIVIIRSRESADPTVLVITSIACHVIAAIDLVDRGFAFRTL